MENDGVVKKNDGAEQFQTTSFFFDPQLPTAIFPSNDCLVDSFIENLPSKVQEQVPATKE